MKSIYILTLSLFMNAKAIAYPTHMFGCHTSGETVDQRMDFRIDDSDLKTGIGNVDLSNWVVPKNEGETVELRDCGIFDGPCRTIISGQWVSFLEVQARAQLVFIKNRDHHGEVSDVIKEIEIDMGRLGRISVKTGQLNEYDSSKGILTSSVYEFNHPQGVEVECSYFQATGPRPGMTGSN